MLTVADWYLLDFYRVVEAQYINQTPMGAGKDSPPLLTPRLEAYEAALRMHGYPRDHWAWLSHWAFILHRLRHGLEKLTGRELRAITPANVRGRGFDAAES